MSRHLPNVRRSSAPLREHRRRERVASGDEALPLWERGQHVGRGDRPGALGRAGADHRPLRCPLPRFTRARQGVEGTSSPDPTADVAMREGDSVRVPSDGTKLPTLRIDAARPCGRLLAGASLQPSASDRAVRGSPSLPKPARGAAHRRRSSTSPGVTGAPPGASLHRATRRGTCRMFRSDLLHRAVLPSPRSSSQAPIPCSRSAVSRRVQSPKADGTRRSRRGIPPAP